MSHTNVGVNGTTWLWQSFNISLFALKVSGSLNFLKPQLLLSSSFSWLLTAASIFQILWFTVTLKRSEPLFLLPRLTSWLNKGFIKGAYPISASKVQNFNSTSKFVLASWDMEMGVDVRPITATHLCSQIRFFLKCVPCDSPNIAKLLDYPIKLRS